MKKPKKNSANAQTVTTTNKSLNATQKEVNMIPEEEKMNFELGTAKDIIDRFVQQCAHLPGCMAHTMRILSNEYAAKIHTIASQEEMTPEQIIEDAEVIFATMGKLRKDFAAEHDHANAVFDEILGHYVPGLQKALQQLPESHTEGSDAAIARNQDQELEKAKRVIAKFVKTCSLHPDSKKAALIDLTNEYFGQRLYRNNRKALSPETIIADATKITATMEKLMSDYSKEEEEHAYEMMDDILSRYVPDLKLVMDNNMKKKGK